MNTIKDVSPGEWQLAIASIPQCGPKPVIAVGVPSDVCGPKGFKAIAVLGEAATDEIIGAWAAAYGFLAEILIGREKQIYEENAKKPGGWEGFKPFRISRKEKESSNITSFYLVAADGAPLPAFKPGQYITVRAKTPDGSTTMRRKNCPVPRS